MGNKSNIDESEYQTIETLIRRKEVGGLPGSKVSPGRYRNNSIDLNGVTGLQNVEVVLPALTADKANGEDF